MIRTLSRIGKVIVLLILRLLGLLELEFNYSGRVGDGNSNWKSVTSANFNGHL